MTAVARTTAFQVKRISMPALSSRRPSGPRVRRASSSSRPTAVGGSTSGSDRTVSSSVRAAPPRRARCQAA